MPRRTGVAMTGRNASRGLPEGVARLIALRGLRSVGEGMLGVAFPLYLLRLGLSTVSIGALFTATAVGKLSLAGALNGLGLGFIIGFLPVWFHLRFGVGPTAVGSLMAVTGLLAGPSFAVATRLARRWGEVHTITVFRAAAPLVLATLPLMHEFGAAAATFVVGMLATAAVIPLRQSFAMGVVAAEERASATGIRATAVRLPTALSPTLTGYLLGAGDFALPFWLMAGCMGASAVLYWAFFRSVDARPS